MGIQTKVCWSDKAEQIMKERFGKDSLIALATVSGDVPNVRTVDALYWEGAFYVITYALSGKMQQIRVNPKVAVSGDWFTGHGNALNLGWFCKQENKKIAEALRTAFSAWIDNGHNNFEDENTCILKVQLTDGVLFSNGERFEMQ